MVQTEVPLEALYAARGSARGGDRRRRRPPPAPRGSSPWRSAGESAHVRPQASQETTPTLRVTLRDVVRLVLPDITGFYREIDGDTRLHRAFLLGRAPDPGASFVKTASA